MKPVCYLLSSFFIVSVFFLSGCSISESVSSSSDSSRSISRSSTSCSGPEVPEETRKAYEKDVVTYVSAIGRSDVSGEDFMRGLGSIASRHSITDWENYKFTYVSIGEGLKKAGLQKDEIPNLPYLKALLGANSKRIDYVKEGFGS